MNHSELIQSSLKARRFEKLCSLKNLNGTQFRILAVMIDLFGSADVGVFTQDAIMFRAEIRERTLYANFKLLEAMGILRRIRTGTMHDGTKPQYQYELPGIIPPRFGFAVPETSPSTLPVARA